MGLAASQARLISLTARMSDLEYEGQQINQQRLTLSNKMNEVYCKAMDMTVPTPPSKIDYATTAYSGRVSGHNVEFRRDDAGKWYGYEVKEGYSANPADVAISKNISVDLTEYTNSVDDSGKPVISKKPLTKELQLLLETYCEFDFTTKEESIDGKNVKVIADENTAKYVYVDTEGNFRLSQNVDLKKSQASGFTMDGKAQTCDIISYKVAEAEYGKNTNFINGYEGLKNSITQLLKDSGEDFKEELVSVIKVGDNFKFLYNSDVKYSGNNKINSQIFTASLDPNTRVPINDIEVQYDPGTTNIKSFTYTNSDGVHDIPVSVTANGDAYDEMKYEAAFRQYELDKIEYDRQQNEYNKQTSIYQRQDKQLELKLTRLDNERNALNTEIESVKKVIQDASEKGFKTFSG